MKNAIVYGLVPLLLLALFDHTMRVDQQNLCQRDDRVVCPDGLWFWE